MEDGTVPKKDYWHDPSLPHGLLFDYLDQYTTETGTAGFKEFIKEIATNPLLTIETALPAFRRILKVDSHIHVPFLEVLLARTQFLIDAQRNLAGGQVASCRPFPLLPQMPATERPRVVHRRDRRFNRDACELRLLVL
jgi:hypothetical protein